MWRNEAQAALGRAAVEAMREELIMTSVGLGDLVPNEQISVFWSRLECGLGAQCYGDGGIVQQVTPKFVVIRHNLGYTFTVGIQDLACGTKIMALRPPGADVEETELKEVEPVQVTDGTLTPELYKQLKLEDRLPDKEIAERYGFRSPAELSDWKKDHGLRGYRVSRWGRDRVSPPDPVPVPEPAQDPAPGVSDNQGDELNAHLSRSMTLAEALARLIRLRENVDCANSITGNGVLTDDVKAVVAGAMAGWEAEIARLESAHVHL